MNAPLPLLAVVQGLLERTYGIPGGLIDAGRFVVCDHGYRRFYGGAPTPTAVGAADGQGARTLVREASDGLRAAIYYPDALIRRLEQYPPQHGLCEQNVDAFATLVEEVDHLLLLAERYRNDRPVTQFEMELQANISKHLVLIRYLAGNARLLDEPSRLWLAHHLFEKVRYADEDPAVRARYRDAAGWAVRFLKVLRPMPAGARTESLRAFHAADSAGKVELTHRLAA